MFNRCCLFVYFLFRLILKVLKLFGADPPAFTEIAEKALMMGEAQEGQSSAY